MSNENAFYSQQSNVLLYLYRPSHYCHALNTYDIRELVPKAYLATALVFCITLRPQEASAFRRE